MELNPFAFRKAKIVYNFGLSECNRVKKILGLRCLVKGHEISFSLDREENLQFNFSLPE